VEEQQPRQLTREELARAAEAAYRRTFHGAAEISARTIRFWTHQKLLPRRARRNQTALYEPELVHRCVFIKRLQTEEALTLAHIQQVLASVDQATIERVASGQEPLRIGLSVGALTDARIDSDEEVVVLREEKTKMIATNDHRPNRRDDKPAALQQLSDSEKESAVADALQGRVQKMFSVEIHAVDYSSRFFERGSFRSPAKIECRVSAVGGKDDETASLDLIRRLPDADLGDAIASELSVRSGESYDVELLRKRYASDGTKQPKLELAFLVATLDESLVTSGSLRHREAAEHPLGGGELERAIAALTNESAPRRHADSGKQCGVYTILQKTPGVLQQVAEDDVVVLYVGMSTDLSAREFDTHFDSAQTGFSTVRRSLGAILKDELRLTALARGRGRARSDFVNFRFEAAGEDRLTAWMREHLSVNTWPTNHYEMLERALIRELRPPLNLEKANPKNEAIRSLRKLCADEARANANRD
jgi:DNA-binding transcriptional MerR regulator